MAAWHRVESHRRCARLPPAHRELLMAMVSEPRGVKMPYLDPLVGLGVPLAHEASADRAHGLPHGSAGHGSGKLREHGVYSVRREEDEFLAGSISLKLFRTINWALAVIRAAFEVSAPGLRVV